MVQVELRRKPPSSQNPAHFDQKLSRCELPGFVDTHSVSARLEKERRRWPRLSVAIPVFVRGSDKQGREILDFCSILNIGAGGVFFVARKQVREHSRILLEIPAGLALQPEEEYAPREFEALVVRAVRFDRFYAYAARFKTPLASS